LLAHGRWFSPGTLASSTTKTGRHDIAEILLKVALNTINLLKDIYLYISSTCFNEKGKLRFFSNVYTTFELQKSLTFGISKSFY
jgi:hypothetical protein